VITQCDHCQADRGPSELGVCPVQAGNVRWMTVPDLAVYALERSEQPLTLYDITRVIRRETGRTVNGATLQVSISNDPRFCWAGKGLYGLYRHGLIPGPRSLAGIARVFLFSHGSMTHDELEFVMKGAGYRFQGASLNQALNNESEVWSFHTMTGWAWATSRTEEAAVKLRRLGVARSRDDFDIIVARTADTVSASLAERKRRLRGEA